MSLNFSFIRLNKFFLIFIFISLGISIFPQQRDDKKYITKPGSRLWIEGTSTLNDFSCRATLIKGFAYLHSTVNLEEKLKKKSDPEKNDDQVEVTILAHSLNCGMDAMNQDMYNAMKADQYPTIRYNLIDAHIVDEDSSTGWSNLATKGDLTIAGVSKTVDILIKVKRLPNGDFRLVGNKELSMKDYNIVPPNHLWGLIRAHDNFSVYFDLIVGSGEVEQPRLKN